MACSRSASATPIWPCLLLLGHVDLRLLDRLRRGLPADRLDVPDSSVMSVMLTLISTRPIFFSSGSSDFWMLCRNLSRSRLMSSIRIEAITWRSWPKMMSPACCLISGGVQAEQADGRVLHRLRVGADGDGEHARHVDADVLDRQRALERHLDLDRLEAEVGVVLDERQDERRAAVDALGGVAAAGLAVDDQHAVRRAALVALHEQDEQAEQHDADGNRGNQRPRDLFGARRARLGLGEKKES